jgi:hypothetical protein
MKVASDQLKRTEDLPKFPMNFGGTIGEASPALVSIFFINWDCYQQISAPKRTFFH